MSAMEELMTDMFMSLGEGVTASSAALSEPAQIVLEFATTPVTFGFGQAFTIYFQGVALVIAAIVIVVNGVTRGYLLNGGTQDMSTGAYIWRSLWPIALIAATPTIVSTMDLLIMQVIADLLPSTASGGEVFRDAISGLWDAGNNMLQSGGGGKSFDTGASVKGTATFAAEPLSGLIGAIIGLLLQIVLIYYWVTITFQIAKRMIQLSYLSIISPLIAAMTAAESTAGDFMTLVKEMAGIGVIVVLQAASFFAILSWLGQGEMTFTPATVFLLMALLASVKQLPTWIQRYTLAPAVSRGDSVFSTGRRLGSSAVRRLFSKGGR